MFMDESARALETFERVMRLGPIVPRFYRRWYGLALQLAGQVARAITVLEDLARSEPDWIDGLAQLAAGYEAADRHEDAESVVENILERDPTYRTSRFLALTHFRDKGRTTEIQRLLIGAGLPE
jgi:tetratricopeptide (TPR) repeat protein